LSSIFGTVSAVLVDVFRKRKKKKEEKKERKKKKKKNPRQTINGHEAGCMKIGTE